MKYDAENEKPNISDTSSTAPKTGNGEVKDGTRVVLGNIDQSLSINSCTIDADIHPDIEGSLDIKNNAMRKCQGPKTKALTPHEADELSFQSMEHSATKENTDMILEQGEIEEVRHLEHDDKVSGAKTGRLFLNESGTFNEIDKCI